MEVVGEGRTGKGQEVPQVSREGFTYLGGGAKPLRESASPADVPG